MELDEIHGKLLNPGIAGKTHGYGQCAIDPHPCHGRSKLDRQIVRHLASVQQQLSSQSITRLVVK